MPTDTSLPHTASGPVPATAHFLNFDAAADQAGLPTLLASWHNAGPGDTLFVLLPEQEQARIPLLQTCCTERGVNLVGSVFPALIHDGRFSDTGAWLLRLPKGTTAHLVEDLDQDAGTCAARIAEAVRPSLEPVGKTLFLAFDALVPNIASILDELYLQLGDAVKYLGVNAGSETFQPTPCLFDNTRHSGKGVLCLLLPHNPQSALAHDYLAPDAPLNATSASGNRIAGIDWRPAFEVYCTQIKQHFGIHLDRENFYQYGVHFPFGIHLANGRTLVRIPVALEESGAIRCVGEVPEYAVLSLLQGPEPHSTETIRHLSEALALPTPPLFTSPDVLLCFYCAGRRLHLGPAATQEISGLAQATGMPLAGALSLGEIGSLEHGIYPHFHNGAIVCIHWQQP